MRVRCGLGLSHSDSEDQSAVAGSAPLYCPVGGARWIDDEEGYFQAQARKETQLGKSNEESRSSFGVICERRETSTL